MILDNENQNPKGVFGKELLSEISNALVFNLYFGEHMVEREIEVLGLVEADMASVMQGRRFEDLSDEDKQAVADALHAIWSSEESEVRKRINLFASRSPDILKPILES